MNILLAVTGSIAAYKTFDIARGLINLGHNVRVILTTGAKEFVLPQVYSYLGVEKTYESGDDFLYPLSGRDFEGNVLHVELGKWAHRLIIVPCSANTISKLAGGEASDLLTSIYLAFPKEKPIVLFPAMNTRMLQHNDTLTNIEKIQKEKNVFIQGTQSGKLVCGEEGEGKLTSINKTLKTILFSNPFISVKSKKVLITTGATVCPLDPVRYLTNSSSGITGLHFACEALKRGFQVDIIVGIYATIEIDDLEGLPGVHIQRVKTPFDMEKAVLEKIKKCHFYISAAAVSDFVFTAQKEKIKKKNLGQTLKIEPAPDILQNVIKLKIKNLKIVGFAAETNPSDEVIREKYLKKPVDLLVGTLANNGLLGEKAQGFNNLFADYKIFKKGKILLEETLSKNILAEIIFDQLGKL